MSEKPLDSTEQGKGGAVLIAAYLAAIVGANLTIAEFGPIATIPVAFLLIGLDLVARDRLHDRWGKRGSRALALRMGALIATGGAMSYVLNADAGRIAIASCVAFTAAAIVDSLMYHGLRHRPQMLRVNGSNVPAALVDSILFPTIAFGVLMPQVVAGQFAAKVIGGAVWAFLLYRNRRQVVTA